jgi:hypothetical protein
MNKLKIDRKNRQELQVAMYVKVLRMLHIYLLILICMLVILISNRNFNFYVSLISFVTSKIKIQLI